MRILVRTSKWAVCARWLGSFALPLTIIPVLMHRGEAIPTTTFVIVELVALAVAGLAVFASIAAFARIWVTGDHGWARAVTGLVFGLACLAPLGLWIVDFVRYPVFDQVSTDTANPPPLAAGETPAALSPAVAQQIAASFPNVKTRSYPLPTAQMFDLVNKLVAERGWDVRRRHDPTADNDDGQINAVATTLLGFRDEVSIRVAATADSSSIDMRSASLSAVHEPGDNAARVEDFLTALDARVTLVMKDEPAGAAAGDDTDTDNPPPDRTPITPAPAPRGRKR